MNSILFRLDASDRIGYGHLFRCISLAQKLKKKFKTYFIFNDLEKNLKDLMTQKKLKFFLNKKYKENYNFEKVQNKKDQLIDAKKTLEFIEKLHSKIVILDDYKKNYIWEKLIKNSNCKVVVLDDLANRKHVCDILCDSNILSNYRHRYKKKVSKKTKLLLGKKFIILRDEFRKNRKRKILNKKVKKIHFCLNNLPKLNFVKLILDSINILSKNDKKVELEIFLNKRNMKVINFIKTVNVNFSVKILTNVRNISKYINEADLGIGFAGTSMYERACLGLPTLTFSNSKNQDLSLNDKKTQNIIYPINKRKQNKKDFLAILTKFMGDYNLRYNLSKFGQKEVDGLGTNRILKEIVKL